MAPIFRGVLLAAVSVLTLTACGTTRDANVSNSEGANRVDTILERAARDAKASGNTVETLALLEQIYKRNPDDAAVATGFGQALREDEQFTRARQVLLPHTTGDDAYPDAVMELSMVQLSLGQYKEAELTARKAVELDPESGRAYLALGTALDAQNYHEQAEVAFRRGIDKWKGDPAPIMNNLALNLASQNKLDQAIDMLEKAKAISPGRMEIERNLRIINTLKEGADDFYTKKEKPVKAATVEVKEETKPEKVEPAAAPKAEPKKEPAKKETRKDVDNKQLPKDAKVEKPAAKKVVVEVEENTNRRGSTQSFNSN